MKGSVNWTDHLLNFVSVIAGVTLAFLISNWAEENRIEKEFLQNVGAIYDEVSSDVHTFESYQIPDNNLKVKQISAVLSSLSDGTQIDSLDSGLEALFSVNNYSPSNTALNSLANSGKLDLIKDLELKSQLLAYRDLSLELQKQGEFQVDYMLNKLFPWFLDRPEIFLHDASKLYQLSEYDKSQVILLLNFYVSLVSGKVEKYQYALEQGKEIQKLLQMYMEE